MKRALAESRVLAIDCDLALAAHILPALNRSATELLKDIARSSKITVAATSARPIAEASQP